jgi:hypothetical protein
MTKILTLAALLAVTLMAGCAPQAASTNPFPPVPALIPETMPLPPVTSEPLMWQPGHWDWNSDSHSYDWTKGEYVPAEGHGNLWMPGWWTRSPAGWTWQPPHWTS